MHDQEINHFLLYPIYPINFFYSPVIDCINIMFELKIDVINGFGPTSSSVFHDNLLDIFNSVNNLTNKTRME